ncbi:hypothetical protein [Alcanivorax sp. 1008]|uniref:hypothetical protein n=1 Tax=Alcanivorax sp. 1008 TaxID=2816853 RepID=UPI001DF50CD7|nr:hypothetical protein [Alcanivorax sp. 1008]MCC1496805.1 hypothetical protein [Alcanivorax sp. 1008]
MAKAQRIDQAPRVGEVGQLLGSGDVVMTNTGRQTSPFPKVSLKTNRSVSMTMKRVETWLMENALDEALARGDDYNATLIRGAMSKPSQEDKDSAELYLFGDFIPPVKRSILKPLGSPRRQDDDFGSADAQGQPAVA